MSTPTIFCLHALGSSRLEFEPLGQRLGDEFEVVAFDLPGFGEANRAEGLSVDEMVDGVIRKIRRHGSTRFLLAGHSMGGKIATLVAARILDGTAGLFGLTGVVLLAASPPSPEPMSDESRARMLGWAATGRIDADAARTFIDDNVGAPLGADADERALADLQRSRAEAWTVWLERGSREDRSDEVGTLDVPAVLLAGGADGPLGEDGQRRLNLPIYRRADVVVLEGAGHLLPLERPDEVADAVRTLWREHAGRGPEVPVDVGRVIASGRTNTRTRRILARRALADRPSYEPRALTPEQLESLRALAARVVPQTGEPIDLAARVDSQLHRGHSDGWRNVALPPDPEAYALGLTALAGFGDLSEGERDATLAAIVDGSWTPPADTLTPEQMTLWFEDCRVDLSRTWLAHPATMARIGFDGFANGGDVQRIQGFHLLAADTREDWEPLPDPVGIDHTQEAAR